ncbi:SWA2 [Candida jiufengensis]|uniref:SWA2 n=1 Tax=Candida jiufengensis TaxID=497108 RepID=UPI002224549A|nr:SWA2 [Candida jiufengensis]KAI5957155.1 SWA2 [Candida jiufengensis]
MPPKKDAFADLFQSASANNNVNSRLNKLSLSERQKLQQQPLNQSNSINSSWSNLNILSPQSSSHSSQIPSRVSTPKAQGVNNFNHYSINSTTSNIDDDPFAIFNKPEPQVQSRPQSQSPTISLNGNSNHTQHSNQQSLLDDDDFIDIYPEQKQSIASKSSTSHPIAPPKPIRPTVNRNNSNNSHISNNSFKSTKKDQVLAELIDIGFSIEDSNEAISQLGPNLQDCVNYIMNKNSGSSTSSRSSSRTTTRDNSHQQTSTTYYEEDDSILGIRPDKINFNEIGNDLFKKANSFYNFSKKKVIENLENFNNNGNNNSDNLPQWMKNQNKYKSQAHEKTFGGEDYGSDDENINQEEISKYMRLQREKEKQRSRERSEERSEEVKQKEKDYLPSRPQRPISRTSSPIPPKQPQRPSNSRSSSKNGNVSQIKQEPSSNIRNNDRQSSTPSSLSKSSTPSTSIPVKEEVEVDLLGISSSTKPNTTNSNLRDSTPLNQIIESDYTSNKAKASESFKNGDFVTSLELYTKCLDALPPTHEYRVIILSNLSLINKNLGHLKESLINCEEAFKLISIDECSNDSVKIDNKPVKYWFTKLLSIKAESLELMEKFKDSLEVYNILIQKFNKNDKKIMDGKRRVDKIVNPQNHKPPPTTKKPTTTTTSKPTATTKSKIVEEKELDSLVKDSIIEKIKIWQQQKNNELRKMLINLNEILPHQLNSPKLLNLSTNDVIMPKQVKINYLKIINLIHPDKTHSIFKDDLKSKFLCNEIFIILNERWEIFKIEENL